jgi:hypothetical protein
MTQAFGAMPQSASALHALPSSPQWPSTQAIWIPPQSLSTAHSSPQYGAAVLSLPSHFPVALLQMLDQQLG